MKWIKNVIVDIAMVIVIIAAVTTGQEWAAWIVWIYTPFMLVLKLITLLGSGLTSQFKRAESEIPDWFFHAIYAVSVVVLLAFDWRLTAAQWAAIWLLSALAASRSKLQFSKA